MFSERVCFYFPRPFFHRVIGCRDRSVTPTMLIYDVTPPLQPKQPEGLGTPNMDTLMAKVEEPPALVNPPEAVMDRIHFVINNVTASNLSSKVGFAFPPSFFSLVV